MIVTYDRQNIFIVQVTRVCFFTRAIVFRVRQEPIRVEHFTAPPLIVTLRPFANIKLILLTAAVKKRNFFKHRHLNDSWNGLGSSSDFGSLGSSAFPNICWLVRSGVVGEGNLKQILSVKSSSLTLWFSWNKSKEQRRLGTNAWKQQS